MEVSGTVQGCTYRTTLEMDSGGPLQFTGTGNGGTIQHWFWQSGYDGQPTSASTVEECPVDDPWADPDEDGVGSLGEFTLVDRSEGLPAYVEWLGIAVGIFVEPVDWVMTAVEIYRDPTNPLSYLGIIPLVPAGAGKIIKATANIASDVIRNLPLGIILKTGDKNRGLEHIIRGHGHGTPNASKGKFQAGMGQHEIAQLLHDALEHPSLVRYDSNDGTKDIFEAVMPNTIGIGVDQTTLAQSATRKIRIVFSKATNEIVSAFPIPE